MTPRNSIILTLVCSLTVALAGEDELRFTPERINIERMANNSYQAFVRGNLSLPIEGLLFQPLPYPSDIPEQKKPHQGAFVYSASPSLQFSTPSQPLTSSAAAYNCTITATLGHFWPSCNAQAQFDLDIELSDIPQTGELKIKEQVPFILAQGVIYGEKTTLKPEQIKPIHDDISQIVIGKLYHIKLGIKANEAIYCYQFFTANGEQLSDHIREIKSNTKGELELEGEFLNGEPHSFRTIKLREPRPILLNLNASLKLPAEQIARAIQQSLGADSPNHSQWTSIYLTLSPQMLQHSNALNLIWNLSGFKGKPEVQHIWSNLSQERYLENSSKLNECTTLLKLDGRNGKQQFRLSLPHPPSSKLIHFDETLSFKLFEGQESSDILPLKDSQRTTHIVNGHEYTASPDSHDEHQGITISGLSSNDSIVGINFLNNQGAPIDFSFASKGGAKKGVFFAFQGQHPAAFQIKYQTKQKKHSLPCRFTIPLPEWKEEM